MRGEQVVMTGAEAILEAFTREGVDTVFGLPGGAVLPLYDALYDASLRHVLVRHEQAAALAADGYARATGRVGVCISTSGPGATNLVTGLANAHADSVPVVALTGNVPVRMLGTDAFQEADIFGATQGLTKHNYQVRDVGELPRIIRHAFHIARTGRPGPVLIDIPKDVFSAEAPLAYPEQVLLPGYGEKAVPRSQVARMAEAILDSAQPVLYVGGGANNEGAAGALMELAERYRIPVTTTLMAMGAFPAEHPLFLGMPGMHGTYCANTALSRTDCLIAVGARFDDRVTGRVEAFASGASIIHINIDAADVGKIKAAHHSLISDSERGLRALLSALEERSAEANSPRGRRAWVRGVMRCKDEHPLRYTPRTGRLVPQQVIEALHEATDGSATVTTGVGQHQMWAAMFYPLSRPARLLTSGGLGTMGYGLPAAVGAQVGRPDELVLCIDGDGSFQMNSQELATVSQYGLPIKMFIINNGSYGMVRQWQSMFFGGRYSFSDLPDTPDFMKLAEAYGVRGSRVDCPDGLRDAIMDALDHDGPALVDCIVCKDENVFPMVPPGSPLTEVREAPG